MVEKISARGAKMKKVPYSNNEMIPLEEFRSSLGDKAKELTEDQILKLREHMDSMAGILFDMWLKKKNNINPEISNTSRHDPHSLNQTSDNQE